MPFSRWVFAIGLLASVASAGVIVTDDGRRLEGDLKKTPEGWNVTAADGSVTAVPTSQVKSIELSSATQQPEKGLASLRRSVAALDDINKIIERYERFIEQSQDPAVDAEGQKDLAQWRERLKQKLVKVGKDWVTPQERADRLAALNTQIDQARVLLQQNRVDEADETLDAVSALDAANVSANYLRGVIALRRNKPVEARKAFTDVQQAIVHAPTLHNLSVINFRTKQWSAACALMDQAMAAAPNVQQLIDHAAELLAAVPEDQTKIAAYQKLGKRFADQDARLQQQMAQRKMYRWGASWVDQTERDRLAAMEAEITKRIEQLQSDFSLTENRIQRIDTEIKYNESLMSDMASRSVMTRPDGTIVRTPLPMAYYDLQQKNAQLAAEGKEMVARLETLRESAKRTRAELPRPRFSGVIPPIEEEGVPMVLPKKPQATAPATEPPATKPAPVIRVGPADDFD